MLTNSPANDAPYRLIENVAFGEGVIVYSFTNLYGCQIGDHTRIGSFVEIQAGAIVGSNCKIESHTLICDGVEIEDEVFVGHGVMFVNDKFPRAAMDGRLLRKGEWKLLRTFVEEKAALGSGSVIVGNVRIGRGAIVGAGAVVTHDVEPGQTVAGVPARDLRDLRSRVR